MSVWVVTQDDTGSLPDVDVDLSSSLARENFWIEYTRAKMWALKLNVQAAFHRYDVTKWFNLRFKS